MRAKRAITVTQIAEIEAFIDTAGIRDERRDEVRWELIKYQAELEGLRRRNPRVAVQGDSG